MKAEEIKFKAQRVGDREWVYGSYTQMREEDHNECFRTKPHKTYHRIWQWEAGDWNMGGYANYEVIPETVCQFTGLKDKNGIEIYRDDKFQYRKHKWYLLDDFIGVVKFKDGCFGYECNRNRPFTPFSEFDKLQKDFLDHIEIIGNIHDKHKQQ
jgi:uncharacterized phage protein (TIGR01671 family)